MKKAKRMLVFVLALGIVFSCMGLNAFAADASNVVQYGKEITIDDRTYSGYVAFGDSVSRGCGATEDYANGTYYRYEHRRVEGAFPLRVAEAVGCSIVDDVYTTAGNNYYPFCFPGQTLTQVMDAVGIEDGYYDELYDHGLFGDIPGRYATFNLDVEAAVKSSRLITIELGICDTLWRAATIANDLTGGEINADWVKKDLEELYKGYDAWANAYPIFLRQLQEWNPNATIVIVGVYNTGMDGTLTDDLTLPVGQALSSITALMNAQYKQWADEFGVIFVDISNVDIGMSQYGWSFMGDDYKNNSGVAGHPTPEGNAYIARQVLASLPAEEPVEEKKPTDIVVDLGRFNSVDYVLVDGVKITNYSLDGNVLTIPYISIFANNLTVSIVQSDGKIALVTYQLVYKDGYTAYKMYSTGDVVGNVKKVTNTATTIGKKAVSKLAGLFSK